MPSIRSTWLRLTPGTAIGGLLAIVSPAMAQQNMRSGVVLGGVTGAVIGGVVGNNHKDQAAEGALIGGAVGAVAGGLLGNHRDRAIAERRYYEQQQQQRYYRSHNGQAYGTHPYQPPGGYTGQPTIITTTPVYGAPRTTYRNGPAPRTVVRRPVTMVEVINMTRSGVSDTVIVAHIQSNGVAVQPDVNDVILLSQEGVSDYVITAMQTTHSGGGSASGQQVIYAAPGGFQQPGGMPVQPSPVIRESRSPGPTYAPPKLLERRGF